MSTYSRVRASGRGYSSPYQPSTTCGPDAPSPRMKRPFERWSSVIAAIAIAVGVRAEIWQIDVPSLMRSVAAPHHASGVSASEPYASAVQHESKPSFSAAASPSGTPAGGPAPQYPIMYPSFTGPHRSLTIRERSRAERAGGVESGYRTPAEAELRPGAPSDPAEPEPDQ